MEYIALLKQRNFTKLWLAQILSQVAANLLNFALIILVFDLTIGSRFASFSVSLLVLSFAIPSIFCAPAAGTYVDFWDRKKIMFICNFLRAIIVLLYIPFQNQLAAILLLTFFTATVTQFFLPAEAATIPKVVPPKLLLTANSLFVFSMYAAFVVGFSASGPVVELLGHHGPYVLTSVMFALAAVLVAFLPSQKPEHKVDHLPKLHIWRQLQENWRIIHERPDRYFSIMQMAITQGIGFILITLAPALSLALLHIPLQQASHFIIIPVGVGMVLGVLLINVVTRRRDKTTVIQTCLILAGVILTVLGLTGQLYRTFHGDQLVSTASIALIVGILMLMLGIVNAMISAAAQTLLQESTSDENRGKVFGSLQMMINIASTLPVFVAGLLSDLFSVTKVITLIGAVLLSYALYMLWRFRVVETKKEPLGSSF